MGNITDPIGDALTRIRNAQTARHATTTVNRSRFVERILTVLKDEGFINGFGPDEDARSIKVELKYTTEGDPMIEESRRVSTPGRRTYSAYSDLPRVHRGLGILVLSTSQGVMSDRQARKLKIGGEVLASIG